MRNVRFIIALLPCLLWAGGCQQPKKSTYQAPRGAADQLSGSNMTWDGASDKQDRYWNFQ